jgi:hypothetical protein
MPAQRLLALSIDLDALDLYLGLYGLSSHGLSDAAKAAVPARAAARFGELCASLGVKGTLFVVGRDLALGRGKGELLALHRAGHELASHSFSHDYALSRRSPERIDEDLARAEEELESLCGVRPRGFRAPGYTLSDPLLEVVRARGYAYDSSLLPSPPYYAAKAAVMGALRLLGRESRSILGPPAQLLRSRAPHVHRGLLELPVSVVPGLRVPYIGTLLATAPMAVARVLGRTLAGDELVVVELHGVDLLDASDGVPEELLARQRDLRVPAAVKRARLESALRLLLEKRTPVTLLEAAGLCAGPASE